MAMETANPQPLRRSLRPVQSQASPYALSAAPKCSLSFPTSPARFGSGPGWVISPPMKHLPTEVRPKLGKSIAGYSVGESDRHAGQGIVVIVLAVGSPSV